MVNRVRHIRFYLQLEYDTPLSFRYQSNRNNASNEPTREKQYGRFLLFLPNARTQIEHARTTDIYRVVHKSLSSYLWLTESVQKWPLFFFNAARIVIQ